MVLGFSVQVHSGLRFQLKQVENFFPFGSVSNSVPIWVVNSGSNAVWVTTQFMSLNLSRFVISDRVTNSGYNHHYIRGPKKRKTKRAVEIP